MARSLTQFDAHIAEPAAIARERIDRTTARALAAAVASLAVATFVVGTSTNALDPGGTVAGNSFESGTVSLRDDDGGRSLVQLENMAPRRPIERCITITYDGTVLPVDVTLGARIDGDIAGYVLATIERGDAGGFDACSEFEAEEMVFDGRLGDLADGDPLALGAMRFQGETISFRFTFELADEAAAAGRSGSIDFVWEAVPL